jgi:putative Ca2+/H+ antiporter (TMEM165/GDT1 family)
MLETFFTTYIAVFVAEIVGDKLLYTSGVLATRFRWAAVISGMSVAFMAKMAVAVAVGATIGKLLPPWLVAALTAVSFIGVAIAMWRQPDVRTPKEKDSRIFHGALIAFTTIFLSEWGDKGMTTAGVWAAANVSVAPSRGTDAPHGGAHRLDRRRRRDGHQGRIGRDARIEYPRLDRLARVAASRPPLCRPGSRTARHPLRARSDRHSRGLMP